MARRGAAGRLRRVGFQLSRREGGDLGRAGRRRPVRALRAGRGSLPGDRARAAGAAVDTGRARCRLSARGHLGRRADRRDVRRRAHECCKRGRDHQSDDRPDPGSRRRPGAPAARLVPRCGGRVRCRCRLAGLWERSFPPGRRRCADGVGRRHPRGAPRARRAPHRGTKRAALTPDRRADGGGHGAVRRRGGGSARAAECGRCHRMGRAALPGGAVQRLRVPGPDVGGPAHVGEPGQPAAGHRTDLGGGHRRDCRRRAVVRRRHGRRDGGDRRRVPRAVGGTGPRREGTEVPPCPTTTPIAA